MLLSSETLLKSRDLALLQRYYLPTQSAITEVLLNRRHADCPHERNNIHKVVRANDVLPVSTSVHSQTINFKISEPLNAAQNQATETLERNLKSGS